jgi:hypothetical protein
MLSLKNAIMRLPYKIDLKTDAKECQEDVSLCHLGNFNFAGKNEVEIFWLTNVGTSSLLTYSSPIPTFPSTTYYINFKLQFKACCCYYSR